MKVKLADLNEGTHLLLIIKTNLKGVCREISLKADRKKKC